MIAQLYLHDRMELRDEPKPNPRVDARSYDSYVGRYAQGSGGVVSVTREGSRLFAQSTGHPRIELFPKSENHVRRKLIWYSIFGGVFITILAIALRSAGINRPVPYLTYSGSYLMIFLFCSGSFSQIVRANCHP